MKDSFIFPIIFMLILVLIFTGIISVMYRLSEARIEAYKTETYERRILGTLAQKIAETEQSSPEDIIAAYPESFHTYVREIKDDSFERKVYKAVVSDSTVAYCFEIGGKGLWGTMQALVSTSTDFRTILSFAIVDQKETPGLGARIEEDWFLNQFSNRLFVVNPKSTEDVTQSYEFIAETQSPENDRQLRRVTGATITSDSVIKMLRDEFNYIYKYYGTTAYEKD
ncbi:MAG: FMN-binding protein [Candidatus Cloacimonadales bacterium]|jgi:Na+-transporting NADH:ubiquinone oxidoreductase subunit C|nr:FMN-binding protein [Candidatus Cloacimonadota bacterium]MDY0380589.1 FMN-binding protein [Candidatus Cloacimonadaceae bacterium]MCB5256976.1 FMN-binding protein [Candidatus Cloacimonadota bacterium]MCB5263916.1 FMN-binding protein [Candidatus Cloacimonadota bacterium]MCB5276581.1 FMN-binding protein [Candidatus Cloacimonadota bacterium]